MIRLPICGSEKSSLIAESTPITARTASMIPIIPVSYTHLLADTEAEQDEIDAAAAALKTAIDGLKLAEEISTAVLEYALELAENVDTEGVADSVVEIFNDRKAAAQDILELSLIHI